MSNASSGVVRVRVDQEVMTRQQLPYFVGISGASAGARGIAMSLAVIPPGGASVPHLHDGFETAIYVLEGRVQTFYGEGLRQSVITGPGDFLFIAAGMPHQAVNLSRTTRALAVVARNDANEQESVVIYDSTSEPTGHSSPESSAQRRP